ncbi:MAG: hypothetical protein M1825_002707 [Sarcosagium campestre]|nr:MAG: hypothetical protein M1825_002707 [Sarcosagium campestre]
MAAFNDVTMEWDAQVAPTMIAEEYSCDAQLHSHPIEPATSIPITPPSSETDSEGDCALSTAFHVLSTEAAALAALSQLYQIDSVARTGFVDAVDAISKSLHDGGKLVITGVGKSGKIGEKLVATMNSLGVLSMFLHPIEALHGDLGLIRPNDTMLIITFSGRTSELSALMPHLSSELPLIMMTSHATSPLTRGRNSVALLPTPIPESEETSFGIAAPTTSTTVALALGDALALAVARKIHEARGPGAVFRSHHPGGAIGMK